MHSPLPKSVLPILLLVIAFCYYGSYYDAGFDFSDDGSVALISQRLLAGERPFADVNAGYNVLWFYPLVGLYKLFGVHFLLVRLWFFALAGCFALLAYLFLTRVASKPVISFLAALAILLVPGPSNRTCISLCVIANLWCLYELLAARSVASWKRRAVIFGCVVGLTFLVRIDIGYFASAIAAGAIFLSSFFGREPWRELLPLRVRQLVLAFAAVAAVHAPFLVDARMRNFDAEMGREYVRIPRAMGIHLIKVFRPDYIASGFFQYAPPPPAYSPEIEAEAAVWTSQARPVLGNALLKRMPAELLWVSGVWEVWALTFLTYASVVGLLALAIPSLLAMARRERGEAATGFVALSVLGLSTVTLPQFFFFRPDCTHLAEFMTGYLVAGTAVLLLLWPVKKIRIPVVAAALFFGSQAAVHVSYGLKQTYMGSIADASGRNIRFTSPHVSVRVNQEEFDCLSGVFDAVQKHASASDYVVCYPYLPGINFLADRRTYQWSLYVDNTVCGDDFDKRAIADMLLRKPAVIVVNNMSINRNRDSTFNVWAAPTKAYILKHYKLRGTFMDNEVYSRDQE